MAYTIHVNDNQRLALLQILGDLEKENRLKDFGPKPEDGTEYALEFWPSMLADLPKIEAEHPGCLHGFCL